MQGWLGGEGGRKVFCGTTLAFSRDKDVSSMWDSGPEELEEAQRLPGQLREKKIARRAWKFELNAQKAGRETFSQVHLEFIRR